MENEGSLFIGLVWGILLSIPLWISILGWIQFLAHLIRHIFHY